MIKRGKEWSWMNKLDYSGMPSPNAYKETNMERKKRKRKRTLKVKIIRFFQEEAVIDWLIFLTFVGTFFLLTYLSTKT